MARRNQRKPEYHKIPLEGLRRLALRFGLGGVEYDDPTELGKLNGRQNWEDGDDAYWVDAYNHAVEHLLLYRNDHSDDHLAAVAWYCFTRMHADAQSSQSVISTVHAQRIAPSTSSSSTAATPISITGLQPTLDTPPR